MLLYRILSCCDKISTAVHRHITTALFLSWYCWSKVFFWHMKQKKKSWHLSCLCALVPTTYHLFSTFDFIIFFRTDPLVSSIFVPFLYFIREPSLPAVSIPNPSPCAYSWHQPWQFVSNSWINPIIWLSVQPQQVSFRGQISERAQLTHLAQGQSNIKHCSQTIWCVEAWLLPPLSAEWCLESANTINNLWNQ